MLRDRMKQVENALTETAKSQRPDECTEMNRLKQSGILSKS